MADIQSEPKVNALIIATDTPVESSIVYANPVSLFLSTLINSE
jgi:hypothetical protein